MPTTTGLLSPMGLPPPAPTVEMMIGESRHPLHPTVRIPPPWPSVDDTADEILSSFDADHVAAAVSPYALQDIIAALRRRQADPESDGPDSPVDLYTSDHFRMYEFKVRRCARGKSHDWTDCPYAHPGEKARRRDPRRHGYSGAACPEFRSGHCPKGDACELAHGVFECWLHPSRYRTQPCKDGRNCTRRVCFFAHTPEQLRVVPGQQSPRSVESLSSSPPASPMSLSLSLSRSPFRADPMAEMIASLRNLQLDKVKSMPCGGSSSGSPKGSRIRSGFYSMPTTPTQSTPTAGGLGYLDSWESGYEEEPAMERVESGRDLRVKMFEKLSMGSSLDTVRPESDPDVWWVSDLVK